MFYSQFILAKKGPLGTIWIAAHLERKLRKNQVADTDIGVSVDSILFPEMPIALRLSSHLLLGVVRIYSRKVNYLFDDCSEALLKVKQAFRSTAVDLPPEESTAPYHSITLPETFDLDDFELPDNEGNYVDHHISSKDQITLQDTMDGVVYTTSKFGLDERFDDDDASGLDLDEELLGEKAATAEHATGTSISDVDPQASAHANDIDIDIANQLDDEYDGDNEPVDYAQAPCTPGLWEEPNLSNIQETSTCDDHQEPENHSITEFAVKENLENASSKDAECLPHEQHHNLHERSPPFVAGTQETFHNNTHNQFEPHEKTLPHIAATEQMLHHNQFEPHEKTLPHFAATEQILHNQFEPHEKTLPHIAATEEVLHHNQFEPHEKTVPHIAATGQMLHHNLFEPHEKSLPHIAAATEQMLMGNLGSTSNTESLLIGETVVPVSADPSKVEDLLNKNVRHEQPEVHTVNENYAEYRGNQENACQLTTEMESNIEPSGKDNLVGIPQVAASLEPKDSTIPVLSSHYGMPSSDFPGLRPCVTPLKNKTDAQGPHATEALVNNFPEIHRAEVRQNEQVRVDNVIERPQVQVVNINRPQVEVENINMPQVQVENFNMPQVQVENINRPQGQVENINSPYTSDFPPPEKRLSLPHWLSDVPPRHFVPETTPLEKDIIATSGKKRSFAESSMSSAQSLNLNESSGFFTTNMTPQTLNLNESSGFFTTNMSVQNPSLSGSSGFFTTNMTLQNPNLNGSSGFFTTNMSVQNPNLNGSSGFTINMSGQPVVNDDDLLSSILVGRKSSILKTKPTPVVTPPTKRRRASAPKTGIPKRKVLMDDNMVLHGDTIRQQLTNTEDIRRLRKKAPCTPSEISMLEKQFWEDEIFSEPIFTGVSTKLASLHTQLRDIRKIVVSHNVAPLEGEKDPKSISENIEKDMQPEVGPSVLKENEADGNLDPVAEPTEIPSVTDSQKCDNKSVNSDYYGGQTQIVETGDVAEPMRLEHDLFGEGTAMEVDAKSFPDDADNIEVSVMPTEVEPPAHAANMVTSITFDMSASLNEVQMDASLQTDAPGVHSNENMDSQSVDMDLNSNKPTDIASEKKIDDAPVKEISEEKHEQDNELLKSEEGVVNEDAALTSNVESDAQNLVYNGIFGEEFVKGAAYNTQVSPVLEDVSLDQRENSGHMVTFETPATNVEDIPTDNKVVDDDDEFTHSAAEHDTDFLNFDDADDDEGGDYAPDVEATRVIDNSGWSSRTKAVAKYLQLMFDKEGERGRNMLAVNNLLVGKTRKEASRMFFETLVLKTKDYIHVEQADPFGNINVFPRAKLLKSDF